ncbi:uncharacterized protein IL334_006145 [Kwoniella shivajii]|uniref:Uncharacterized protein n=1 Tax=Kwoniella shivajii TaxID=564305 RepID=A0ABZ1D541_9TREE|nr:hypothetical protein IL334_006145 [Kwoniella shivajii]
MAGEDKMSVSELEALIAQEYDELSDEARNKTFGDIALDHFMAEEGQPDDEKVLNLKNTLKMVRDACHDGH